MSGSARKFIESIIGAEARAPRWLRLVTVAALIGGALAYAAAALAHGRMNNLIYDYNDQRVYMNYARSLATPGFDGFIPRMRMPLYPHLLKFAARPEMSYEDFFPVAQAFNVVLSLLCLVALFLFLRRWLGSWFGLCFVLVAGAQLFVLRAAYVQPEILLATLITASCAQLIGTLRNPTPGNAVLSGLLLCAWFLTKASAQAALVFFGLTLAAKWLGAGRGSRWRHALAGLLVVAAFVLPMSRYLHTSWKVFGNPFYNAQSQYYIWAESEREKHRLQRSGLDRSLKDMAMDPAELPSASKYFAKHPWPEIRERLRKGVRSMFKMAFIDCAALYYMVAVWAGVAVWTLCRAWPASWRAAWDWKWEALFIVSLLTVFTFLFGWFVPIKAGPRLIESITLPVLFCCMAVARHFLDGQSARCGGVHVSLEKCIALGFLSLWAATTFLQVPADLASGYFGG